MDYKRDRKILWSLLCSSRACNFGIQVANDISEERTFERDVSPLLAIRDAYPKMLIARTYQPEYQHEGIRVVDAADWLSNCAPQK